MFTEIFHLLQNVTKFKPMWRARLKRNDIELFIGLGRFQLLKKCVLCGAMALFNFFLQEYNICFKMAKNSGSGWLLVFKGAGAQSVKNAVCYVCMHVSAQVGMFY